MAVLDSPHWEATVPGARTFIITLGRLPSLKPFYLAGGTALALRLGHRISEDLDVFANIDQLTDAIRQNIIDEIQSHHVLEVIKNSPLGLILKADSQPASFFSYGYPMLEPTDSIAGLQVAGIADIGLMKLDAIAGRGARKDFCDLYFIARQIPLDVLFARATEKYPHFPRFGMRVLETLVDFDFADGQNPPTMLQAVDWETMKAFFVSEATRLGQLWFGSASPDP